MSENNTNIIKAFDKSLKRRPHDINKFEKCGIETIERINKLNPSLVLDLGCGDNQYKDHIQNLVGIDIANRRADIKADISHLPYNDETVDACLCYGSINFGDDITIEHQLLEMKRVLKKNGIAVFRGNMNEHGDDMYYGWNEMLVQYWSDTLDLKLIVQPTIIHRLKKDGSIDHDWVDRVSEKTGMNHRTNMRLFWIWQK